MKGFSLKWKLFLLANYLQLIVHGLLLLAIFLIGVQRNGSDETTVSVLFTVIFLLFFLNDLLNVYTVHHYFPDIPNPAKHKNMLAVSGTCNTILSIVLLIIYTVILASGTAGTNSSGHTGHILVTILFIDRLIGVFVLILQFRVSRYLAYNHANKIDSLINSIGNNEENEG